MYFYIYDEHDRRDVVKLRCNPDNFYILSSVKCYGSLLDSSIDKRKLSGNEEEIVSKDFNYLRKMEQHIYPVSPFYQWVCHRSICKKINAQDTLTQYFSRLANAVAI